MASTGLSAARDEEDDVALRIVIPDDSPPVISGTPALDRIRGAGETIVHTTPAASEDELIARLDGAHTAVNIRGYSKFTDRVLQSASPALKHVAIWGTGTDNIDLPAARRLSIVVSNTPNTATDAIAEHCLALMLAVARRLVQLDGSVKRAAWERGMLYQCLGKTLGLIGTGVIGTRFGVLGHAIGMRVIAWTFHPDPEKAKRSGFTYVPTLDALLGESDVVSLHLRSSPDTRGLLGAEQFERMRRGVIFINTARGDIVDETALAQALRSGHVAGAGLDVLAREPVTPDNPLLSAPNTVFTPHTSGTTPEALANGLNLCAENVTRFLASGQVAHRVV